MDYNSLLQLAIHSVLKAGEEIMTIYTTDFSVETKSDRTPVTLADKSSGRIIGKILEASGIPVISEEENVADYSIRKNWKHVWIVDPLDGTKEFVKRNGEFAVNVALVEDGRPVIGVIYAPVTNQLYFAATGIGSFKLADPHKLSDLKTITVQALALPSQKLPQHYTVVASRSHLSREVNQHIDKLKRLYGEVSVINIGSSIKQCWVADGLAHEYPRVGTTMEWDTAAGQCILEQMGGALVNFETGQPLSYNKPDMRNTFFIAKAQA